jgi:uncharacterized protein
MVSTIISQLGSTPPRYSANNQYPASHPVIAPKYEPRLLFSAAHQYSQVQRLEQFRQILRTLVRYVHADATLTSISALTPNRLRQIGDIKGVIFDLDDTLIPLFKGQLSDETINSLQRLKAAGYQMGIVTNNIQQDYCKRVRQQLAEAGVAMPFIEDARKPSPFGFETMRRHFNIRPSQTVVVGDGLISDVVCAKRMGYKAIRARWHTKNFLLCWEPFLSLWDSMAILLNAMRIWFCAQRKPLLTGISPRHVS